MMRHERRQARHLGGGRVDRPAKICALQGLGDARFQLVGLGLGVGHVFLNDQGVCPGIVKPRLGPVDAKAQHFKMRALLVCKLDRRRQCWRIGFGVGKHSHD